MDVVVLNKRASGITVVLGEGEHSMKCDLSPTRNGMAFAGSVMGREIVYERSQEQVKGDIDRLNPTLRNNRGRSRLCRTHRQTLHLFRICRKPRVPDLARWPLNLTGDK